MKRFAIGVGVLTIPDRYDADHTHEDGDSGVIWDPLDREISICVGVTSVRTKRKNLARRELTKMAQKFGIQPDIDGERILLRYLRPTSVPEKVALFHDVGIRNSVLSMSLFSPVAEESSPRIATVDSEMAEMARSFILCSELELSFD